MYSCIHYFIIDTRMRINHDKCFRYTSFFLLKKNNHCGITIFCFIINPYYLNTASNILQTVYFAEFRISKE